MNPAQLTCGEQQNQGKRLVSSATSGWLLSHRTRPPRPRPSRSCPHPRSAQTLSLAYRRPLSADEPSLGGVFKLSRPGCRAHRGLAPLAGIAVNAAEEEASARLPSTAASVCCLFYLEPGERHTHSRCVRARLHLLLIHQPRRRVRANHTDSESPQRLRARRLRPGPGPGSAWLGLARLEDEEPGRRQKHVGESCLPPPPPPPSLHRLRSQGECPMT